jgi:hypothetical protein
MQFQNQKYKDSTMLKISHIKRYVLCAIILFPAYLSKTAEAAHPKYVIEISVDGLGSGYLQTLLNNNQLPNFKRLKNEGTSTLNARDDYDITVTLPNHITMVTARGIKGASGHNWESNGDPAANATIHNNKYPNDPNGYVASVFDVVHNNGLRTAMYATKTKFSLFDTSYNSTYGASDTTGIDNGKGKIDTYYYNSSSSNITSSFVTTMTANPFHYSFIHYADGDAAGHTYGWGSTQYNNAIIAVDGYLGSIFTLVTGNATLQNKTVIILTADHGGKGTDHSNAADPCDYTIPFFVWGPCISRGYDLYALNSATRLDPGASRPTYSASPQPIRNGDGANLAMKLLGLPPIFGSTINAPQNLATPLYLATDLSSDCIVDFKDFTLLANDWLTTGI